MSECNVAVIVAAAAVIVALLLLRPFLFDPAFPPTIKSPLPLPAALKVETSPNKHDSREEETG